MALTTLLLLRMLDVFGLILLPAIWLLWWTLAQLPTMLVLRRARPLEVVVRDGVPVQYSPFDQLFSASFSLGLILLVVAAPVGLIAVVLLIGSSMSFGVEPGTVVLREATFGFAMIGLPVGIALILVALVGRAARGLRHA